MTQVAFHFNAPDKLDYVCRLSRKAYGRGARLVVTGQAPVLEKLDALLWTFSSLDFLPHCRVSENNVVVASSPIVLSETVTDLPHTDVLINLGLGVPDGYEAFGRLIEIVSMDVNDRELARVRWKQYLQRGIDPVRHDLAQTTE